MTDTMPYIFSLGNHPELSATEIWRSLQAHDFTVSIAEASPDELVVHTDQEIPPTFFQKLGGTIQVRKPLLTAANLWPSAELAEQLLGTLHSTEKLTVGISCGANVDKRYAMELGKALKKAAKAQDVRLRFVLAKGKSGQLNAAQIIFNQLTTKPNKAWQISSSSDGFAVSEVTHIQDIQAYAQRDVERPLRDAKIGMLPPKLAQIILNIGASQPQSHILDPFCGLGTVLQEGWLMGHQMVGSDATERMARASDKNLAHVAELWPSDNPLPEIHVHNATKPFSFIPKERIDAVVTEPFLGSPLTKPLPSFQLHERIDKLGKMYLRVFTTLHPRLRDGGRILFLLPAWRDGFKLPDFNLMPDKFIDSIAKIGYRTVQLIPGELDEFYPSTGRSAAIYARPDALVGRELTLWEKL